MAIGSWTQRTSGTTAALNAVARGGPSGAKKYVVVGNGGTLLHSDDAISWSPGTCSDSSIHYKDVVWSQRHGLFVAVGETGDVGAGATSTDGVNWTPFLIPSLGPCRAIAQKGGVFVAATRTEGQVARSTNGSTWTSIPTGMPSTTFQAVGASDDAFVLGGTLGEVATSTTGLLWAPRTSGTTTGIVDIAYSPSRGALLAVSSNGTTRYSLDDGATWAAGGSGVTGSLDRKTRWLSGDGGFFVSGTSTNGRFDRRDTETSSATAISTGGATTTSDMHLDDVFLVAVAAGGDIRTASIT